MIRQITPTANSEIASGMKTAILNAIDQRTRSVSTAKTSPTAVTAAGTISDPESVVLERRLQPVVGEDPLVVVDPDELGRRGR